MRIFAIDGTNVTESNAQLAPQALSDLRLPVKGYLWLVLTRQEFELTHLLIQATLQRLCGQQLVDLHVADLLNQQLPSRYDYTSQYDLLVFHRLTTATTTTETPQSLAPTTTQTRRTTGVATY